MLLGRLKGPGGVYNLGNALGFSAGLLVAFLGTPESANSLTNVLSIGMRYVAGSPAAVALTVASAIFFWSGEVYHKGWSNGYPPDPKLTRRGDLLSGFGAIALGAGLYLLGNPVLAATSGLLHAAGKFGSAFDVRGELSFAGLKMEGGTLCRNIVLISRVPAIIASTADVFSSKAQTDGAFAFISLAMLACYVIWAIADSMLLSRDSAVIRVFRPGLDSETARLAAFSDGAQKRGHLMHPLGSSGLRVGQSSKHLPVTEHHHRNAASRRSGSSEKPKSTRHEQTAFQTAHQPRSLRLGRKILGVAEMGIYFHCRRYQAVHANSDDDTIVLAEA